MSNEMKVKLSLAHIGKKSYRRTEYHKELATKRLQKWREDGGVVWNKGRKGIHLSPTTEFKKGRRDGNHPEWKGEEASYHAKHAWVSRWRGKPNRCEHCKKTKGIFNWANVSRKYKRELDDWIRLCRKCHHKFDNISEKLWKTRKL